MKDKLYEILSSAQGIPSWVNEINHFVNKTCRYLNGLHSSSETTTSIPVKKYGDMLSQLFFLKSTNLITL